MKFRLAKFAASRKPDPQPTAFSCDTIRTANHPSDGITFKLATFMAGRVVPQGKAKASVRGTKQCRI